jgi:AraC-like DNA-binding protein
MDATAGAAGALHFSTDDLPEHDRVTLFRDVYARSIINFDIEPLPDASFQFSGAFQKLPRLGLASGVCSPMRATRTTKHIDSDDLVFYLSLTGGRSLRQRGREAVVGPGEGILSPSTDEGDVTVLETSRFFSLRLPLATMRTMVSDLDSIVVRTIPRDSGPLRLLMGYVSMIRDSSALTAPEARNLIASHIHDLAALALGATRDATEAAKGRGLRAARLRAIKADIAANITVRDLSVDAVAARHRISPRSIRLLFADDETTFTDFVLRQRLARVHRMLVDPRFADHTISAIAFESGFGDLSHFNHAFRRQYGATPSDVRTEARRENWS